jgi:hypothetical protein
MNAPASNPAQTAFVIIFEIIVPPKMEMALHA